VVVRTPVSSAVPRYDRPMAARPLAMLGRAVRRRCPLCGRGAMFRSWFRLEACCAMCGLSFERDEAEEYWLGAYLLNFIVTEVVFALLLGVIVFATWPVPPWRLIMVLGALQMVITAIVFYPFAKALWLAIDLVFRPPKDSDFPR
jgi:uncharacterized protein (DUF983 family)